MQHVYLSLSLSADLRRQELGCKSRLNLIILIGNTKNMLFHNLDCTDRYDAIEIIGKNVADVSCEMYIAKIPIRIFISRT